MDFFWNFRYTKGFEAGYSEIAASAFDEGKAAGYQQGYEVGNDTGHRSGLEKGYNLGYESGYKTGNSEGNSTGYVLGYEVGYGNGNTTGYDLGCGVGYVEGNKEGFDQGNNTGFSIGYDKGATAGYEEGYIRGVEDGAGRGYTIRDPTRKEAEKFVRQDKTDTVDYVPDKFVCRDFAAAFKNNAFKAGYLCLYVRINFKSGESHALVAFNTTDTGLIFIEPQTDDMFYLKVGDHYNLKISGFMVGVEDDKIVALTFIS